MNQLLKILYRISIFCLIITFINAKAFEKSFVKNDISTGEKHSSSINSNYFNKIFEQKEIIHFQMKDLVIGEISKLLVLDNGNKFVIYDKTADELLLADRIKNTFKILSIEDKIPGGKMKFASFCVNPDSGFWVSNYAKHYILFNNEGKIRKIIPIEIANSSFKFGVSNSNKIIALSKELNKPQSLISINIENEKTNKLFDINFDEKLRLLDHKMSDFGGFLVDKKGFIYLANALENKVYKFFNQNKVVILKSKNRKFKVIDRRLVEKNDPIIHLFQKKMQFSSVVNMFFLSDNLILITYLIDHRLYFEIFNKNTGEVINTENAIIPGLPLYATNESIYITKETEFIDENGNIDNPILLRYELKKEAKREWIRK